MMFWKEGQFNETSEYNQIETDWIGTPVQYSAK